MNLAPGEIDVSWRVYRDTCGRRARGKRYEIDDLDGVRTAYAAAYAEALESGGIPGVSRVIVGGRLNGKGCWRAENPIHIERVGTDLDAPCLTGLDLSLSPDLQRGPAADAGYDMPRYARTRELHLLPDLDDDA